MSGSAYLSAGYGAKALDMLSDLIRLRTDTSAGYRAAADRVASTMSGLGFRIERHVVEGLAGEQVPMVLGWSGEPVEAPAVMFNSHLDTNIAGEGWTFPPFDGMRRGGRVHGRGAVIAKSDVAAYIYGVAAAREAVPDSERTILVAITCDEGAGGYLGPQHMLEQLRIRPSLAMTAGFSSVVGTSTNGAVQGVVTVRGVAIHQAALPPDADAMKQAVDIAAAIGVRDRALRAVGSKVAGISSPTFNVTSFQAGESFGMAPARAQLLIDRRVTPDENLEDAAEDVRQTIDRVRVRPGVQVETHLYPGVEPMREVSAQAPWASMVQVEASEVFGASVPTGGIPIYTDARWFASAGIPTVLFGAGTSDLLAAGINGTDETVAEDDVAATVEVVARVARRVLENEL